MGIMTVAALGAAGSLELILEADARDGTRTQVVDEDKPGVSTRVEDVDRLGIADRDLVHFIRWRAVLILGRPWLASWGWGDW
jgi:hypothetical protein